jgi:hypothetical protein
VKDPEFKSQCWEKISVLIMAQKPQMKIMYIHDDGANYNNYENDDEKR